MSTSPSSVSEKPTIHLCVFIHGLWGNPSHLENLSQALRKAHTSDDLHILVAKKNSGNWTYDGIEVGGERLTREIEDEIEKLESEGKTITKFSIACYSLGGLIARYAIGLLYSKGLFDRFAPTNFTTFATPHLGVRTPLLGWQSTVFNELGARTLSTSGHQLFTVDKFRDTEKPLLAVLADPSTVFMRALKCFKNPSLYANIVNDRTVPFYTAAFSPVDPFSRLDDVELNYVPDYEDVILDSDKPATPRKEQLTYYESISNGARNALAKAPFALAMVPLFPIAITVFLANSGYQAFSSAKRIQAHEEGQGGVDASSYKIPLMLEGAQKQVERVMEDIGAAHGPDHLSPDDTQPVPSMPHSRSDSPAPAQNGGAQAPNGNGKALETTTSSKTSDEEAIAKASSSVDFPTLALTDDQFAMIDSLSKVGFKKYPVHIHKAQHSHAAIVVRINRSSLKEGYVVSRHWVERFEI